MWGESENQHAAGDAEPGCRAEDVGKVRMRDQAVWVAAGSRGTVRRKVDGCGCVRRWPGVGVD